MKRVDDLRGVVPAAITPFTEAGDLDMGAFERFMSRFGATNASGVFVAGTTGEGALLSTGEKRQLVETARETLPPQMLVFAAALQPSTAAVISEINVLTDAGADAAVAVTPYYYGADAEGILTHFRSIADAIAIPLVLYDIPPNTHVQLPASVVEDLAAHPNVIGIKDSSGNFAKFSRYLLNRDFVAHHFTPIQGDDSLDAAALLFGARMLVSGLANLWLEPYIAMWQASIEGRTEDIRRCQVAIHGMIDALGPLGGPSVPAMKAILALGGGCASATRISRAPFAPGDVASVVEL
jgi:4-hydroxy-tetrahydrodipicolinate synthase